MFTSQYARAFAAALLLLALTALVTPALAEIQDYEFQLIDATPKMGAAVISVRLINKKTGKPVPDAVFAATRMDMAPDGMASMAAPMQPLPSTEPGVYRFKADLMMAGGWRLSLAAKVQGETGTLESRLVLKAVQ